MASSKTLSAWRGQPPVVFEPLAHEGLKAAYAQTFCRYRDLYRGLRPLLP